MLSGILLLCIIVSSALFLGICVERRGRGQGRDNHEPPRPKIWRIREITRFYDKETLKGLLEASYNTTVSDLHIAEVSRGVWCATAIFKDEPHSVQGASSAAQAGHNFKIDSDFWGITPLYCGEDSDGSVDIIVVPGLAAPPLGTFRSTDRSSNDIWLRDFLPKDLPNCRVLLYGYDSNLTCSDGKRTMYDIATGLLQAIGAFRKRSKTESRRCIFIGHSLGGIIIKEAFAIASATRANSVQNRLLKSCFGLLLFGVPNQGLRHRELLTMVRARETSERLVNELVVDENSELSYYLEDLNDKFFRACEGRNFQITAFYELLKTPCVVKSGTDGWKRKGPKVLMVTKESAVRIGRNLEAHYQIPLNLDHSTLVKLTSREDHNYQLVLSQIKDLIAEHESGREETEKNDNLVTTKKKDLSVPSPRRQLAPMNRSKSPNSAHEGSTYGKKKVNYSGNIRTKGNAAFFQGDQHVSGDFNFGGMGR